MPTINNRLHIWRSTKIQVLLYKSSKLHQRHPGLVLLEASAESNYKTELTWFGSKANLDDSCQYRSESLHRINHQADQFWIAIFELLISMKYNIMYHIHHCHGNDVVMTASYRHSIRFHCLHHLAIVSIVNIVFVVFTSDNSLISSMWSCLYVTSLFFNFIVRSSLYNPLHAEMYDSSPDSCPDERKFILWWFGSTRLSVL